MDSENCALLKEAAIEFFAANLTSLMPSSGWANMTESAPIMRDIMEGAFIKKKRSAPADGSDEERDYKRMRVSTLRRKLDEKGLDVNGSRGMTISRLEEGENDDGSGNE
jgi:hypothetical protein